MSEIGKKQYFCIFGGGAIRGLAYLGALNAMEELGVKIKSFAGSSVGAVFAVYAALGYTGNEFLELFDEVNFDLFRDVQFSKYTTPDFEVAQAVRISTSLPGLLEPSFYEKNILIDGDIMKSWPMWRVSDVLCPEDCRVIEFRLEGGKFWSNVKNSVEYLNAVFAIMSNFATDYIMQTYQPKDKFDYIKIDTDHILPVQFTLPQTEREKLIQLGYDTTMNYFKNDLLKKKKELLPLYKVILDHLIKAKNSLESDNIIYGKVHICDLFTYLCEAKRYIDTSVYYSIVKFKDYFFSNITESLFFHRLKLKDKREVRFYLNNLVNEVLERCMELEAYINDFEK